MLNPAPCTRRTSKVDGATRMSPLEDPELNRRLQIAAHMWGGEDWEDVLSEMIIRLYRRAEVGADINVEYRQGAMKWRAVDALRLVWRTTALEEKGDMWMTVSLPSGDTFHEETERLIQPWNPVQWREPAEGLEMLDDGWRPVFEEREVDQYDLS